VATSSTGTLIGALERFGRAVENVALIVLLLSLIGLACAQILLRNVFSMGFPWVDELVRIILLWLAMVGAVAATRDHRQIAIDLLSRFLADHWLRWIDLLTSLFAATVTGALCFYSARFVQQSYEFEDLLLGDWPAWVFQIILPVAFGLMFYRYAVMTVGSLLGRRN
jgi:C4-dicarboxylate transporter DctQ subunit